LFENATPKFSADLLLHCRSSAMECVGFGAIAVPQSGTPAMSSGWAQLSRRDPKRTTGTRHRPHAALAQLVEHLIRNEGVDC